MSQTARDSQALFSPPKNPVGYVLILAALVTGGIHLLLAVNVINFSQMLGVLFALNGLGFLAGIGLLLTRFWRRELYVGFAVYAVVTIVALFVFQGFGAEAFYMRGSLNVMAVVAKSAEVVVAVSSSYLFTVSGD